MPRPRKTHCKRGHEFTPENSYVKPGSNSRNCKTCIAAKLKKYRKDNKEYYKEQNRQYKIGTRYGLSSEEYAAMIANQSNRCANPLCRKSFDEVLPYIDHDHSCCDTNGSCGLCVRGVLCNRCNSVLGYVNDDEDVLSGLIGYLTSWKKFTNPTMVQESV